MNKFLAVRGGGLTPPPPSPNPPVGQTLNYGMDIYARARLSSEYVICLFMAPYTSIITEYASVWVNIAECS